MLGTRELVIIFLPCWALGLSASATSCHGAARVAKNSYGGLQNLLAVGFWSITASTNWVKYTFTEVTQNLRKEKSRRNVDYRFLGGKHARQLVSSDFLKDMFSLFSTCCSQTTWYTTLYLFLRQPNTDRFFFLLEKGSWKFPTTLPVFFSLPKFWMFCFGRWRLVGQWIAWWWLMSLAKNEAAVQWALAV